jgi:hypothetical protein
MEKNKMGKYFKYAIGEIILVVIGILIALSINNWNENRKNYIKSNAILLNLKTEFLTNKADLLETSERNTKKYNLVKEILSFTGQPNENLTKEKSDELIYNIFAGNTADVSTGFIDDLLNSSNIYLIKNDSLRQKLTNWNKELFDHKTESEVDYRIFYRNNFILFMQKNYSYEKRGNNILPNLEFKSTFTKDYKSIYKSKEFENIVITKLILLNNANKGYKELIDIIDEIISLIDKEIEK